MLRIQVSIIVAALAFAAAISGVQAKEAAPPPARINIDPGFTPEEAAEMARREKAESRRLKKEAAKAKAEKARKRTEARKAK